MTEKEIRELLQDIQEDLEKLKGEDVSVMFFADKNDRGLMTGDLYSLMALVIMNMSRYPQMKFIFEKAVELFPTYGAMMQSKMRGEKPVHEVIDTYSMDVERMVTRDQYAKNVRNWSLFTFNYPSNWIEAVWWDCKKDFHEHLKRNFEKYDRDMTRFMLELDKGNREKLLFWVFENYKG